MNAAGEGFFRASLAGAGVTDANAFAILRWSEAGGFEVLLRRGDPVPGAPGAALVFARDFVLGENGHAACHATLANAGGGEARALLAGSLDEGLVAAAVTGQPAPALPEGATFSYLGAPSHLRSDGLFVFGAVVEDETGSRDALYARAPGSAPRLLIQSGDTIVIPPGFVRTVKGISIRVPEEPGPSSPASGKSLNEAGEAVAMLSYGSRVGIFVIEAAAPVPEPGAALLLCTGVAVLGAARALRRSGDQALPARIMRRRS